MNMHESIRHHEAKPSGATPSAHASWLRSVGARFVVWIKNCADNYAAAAAYDGLSRLSDAQLNQRGLSRDILARDLNEGRKQAFEQLTSEQPHRVPLSTEVTTMISGSFKRDARARAFQTAAMALVLSAVLAGFVLSLALKDTTLTAARNGNSPSSPQPAIERF
jgi:hypothetical protein